MVAGVCFSCSSFSGLWIAGLFLHCFFSPSFSESPLSLLLFRLVYVSISSICSCVCWFFPFFGRRLSSWCRCYCRIRYWGFRWCLFSWRCIYWWFLLFFPFTRVHPSLSSWSPVSGFVSIFVFVVAVVVVVVVVAVVVVVLVVAMAAVILFVTIVVFWRQDREKWPNCLQFQQSGFLPSTITVIVVSRYDMIWGIELNPPLSNIIVNV